MLASFMNSNGKPEISVLIPAYNGASWIAETLRRVAAAGGVAFEAVVVDNASTDETVALIQNVSGVKVIRNEANRGFSRAVNQAAAASRGRVLVVINQDLYLEPNALQVLFEFVCAKNALVGGELAFEDGVFQPSFGPFPSLAGTVCRRALPRAMRKYDLARPSGDSARAVDWVTGAFVGCRRELFEAVGGFDEDYFMYYEDVDFCLRARKAGFESYFLPSAKAVHLNPYSARDDAPQWLRKEVRRSQMTYFRKHRPSWEYGAIRALNRAYFAAQGWPWP